MVISAYKLHTHVFESLGCLILRESTGTSHTLLWELDFRLLNSDVVAAALGGWERASSHYARSVWRAGECSLRCWTILPDLSHQFSLSVSDIMWEGGLTVFPCGLIVVDLHSQHKGPSPSAFTDILCYVAD